jgi:hypothetical protein
MVTVPESAVPESAETWAWLESVTVVPHSVGKSSILDLVRMH